MSEFGRFIRFVKSEVPGRPDTFLEVTWLDRLYYEVMWPGAQFMFGNRNAHAEEMGRFSNIIPGERVLEIGAGYPLFRHYSGRVGEDGAFVALDFLASVQRNSKRVESMLNILKRRGITPRVVGDGTRLPFEDEAFDLLIASNFSGGDTFREEGFRILRQGGRIVVSKLDYDKDIETAKRELALLEAAGFKDVRIEKGAMSYKLLGGACNWMIMGIKPGEEDSQN